MLGRGNRDYLDRELVRCSCSGSGPCFTESPCSEAANFPSWVGRVGVVFGTIG